jgi:hypothetical protein
MVDGDEDEDEESAHDLRRPAAPRAARIVCAERERHRWGGRRVGSHRCSGWGGTASVLGTSSSTSVTSLTSIFVSLSFHPDAALCPLRIDYSSGSTTASHNHPWMARVHPRCFASVRGRGCRIVYNLGTSITLRTPHIRLSFVKEQKL